jgi:phosphatidylserine decarboxylase
MQRQRFFRLCQHFCFLLVTLAAFSLAYYFPNLPPIFQAPLANIKGSIRIPSKLEPDRRFLSWFNRDPQRQIPSQPRIIVSPADGYVAWISKNGAATHIVIEMRYTDVHIQRVPLHGKVVSIDGEGKPLPANMPVEGYYLDKMLPYQKIVSIETEIGIIKVHQITSYFARRIEVFLKKDEFVKRGQKLGRILAGSTIVLEIPSRVTLTVEPNQNVIGGETIIARY